MTEVKNLKIGFIVYLDIMIQNKNYKENESNKRNSK